MWALVLKLIIPVWLAAAGAGERPGTLTGKEKLAGKATDEQRVNNCKVPQAKRGGKARPDACPQNAPKAPAKTQ